VSEQTDTDEPRSDRGIGRLASRGAAWMFGLNISNRILGLVRTAIVARLLAPDDLGLFGIAMLTQSVIEVFTMLGLNSALARHPDDVEPYLDSAWIIAFVRGVGGGAILVLAAPLVAAFFHEPAATPLIRVLALYWVFGGFINPAIVMLRRRLEFGRLYLYTIVGSVADIAVSIIIAVVYRTPMALILGLAARTAALMIVSYVLVPYRPHLRFDRHRARELMSYGKWVTGTTILRFLYGQGDDIVVGRLLGTASLGLYQIGYKYSNLPTTEITRVLQMVALPVYAKVQNDAARLRKAFVEALESTSLGSIAFAGYIWVITPDFVELVLGPKWTGVIPVMRLLAIWGAVESVSEIPLALFDAVGRPQLGTRRLLVKTILLAALIYPMLHWWDLKGVCLAVMASAVPALVWSLVDGAHISGATVRQVVGSLLPPALAAGAAMAGAVLLGMVLPTGSVWSLIALTFLCLAIYVLSALVARACGYTAVGQLGRRLKSSFARQG
jgi:O-antigen/teichoic acid export membrane protein